MMKRRMGATASSMCCVNDNNNDVQGCVARLPLARAAYNNNGVGCPGARSEQTFAGLFPDE